MQAAQGVGAGLPRGTGPACPQRQKSLNGIVFGVRDFAQGGLLARSSHIQLRKATSEGEPIVDAKATHVHSTRRATTPAKVGGAGGFIFGSRKMATCSSAPQPSAEPLSVPADGDSRRTGAAPAAGAPLPAVENVVGAKAGMGGVSFGTSNLAPAGYLPSRSFSSPPQLPSAAAAPASRTAHSAPRSEPTKARSAH
eukprot:COSAG05_NODE_7730_length_775_cov_0.770710_1_plen_195_part_10